MGGVQKKPVSDMPFKTPITRESGFWTSKPGIIPEPFSIQRPSRDDRRQPGSSPHTVPLPCPPTTSVPCTMRTHGPPSCCLPAAFLLPAALLPCRARTLPECGLPCSRVACTCGVVHGAFSAPRPARVGGLAHDHSAGRVPQLPPAHAARRVRALRHGPRQLVPENAGRTPRPAQVIDDTERPVAIATFLKEDRRRRDPRHADGAKGRLGKKRWRGGPSYSLNNSVKYD